MRIPMPKPFLITLVLTTLLLMPVSPSGAEPFFNSHAKGWHWYEILPLPHDEEATDEESSHPQKLCRPKTPDRKSVV